jgi:Cu-Zn family superoxide dismutase
MQNEEISNHAENLCKNMFRGKAMMRKSLLIAMALGAVAVFGANKPTTVILKDGAGRSVGTVILSDGPNAEGVRFTLNVKGLPPGEHAIHLHETPKCEGPHFESVGGHFNPDKGIEAVEGQHAGDMPDFTVNPQGIAHATVLDPRVTLSESSGHAGHSVFNVGGTALVIDAEKNLKSDPAGNASEHIACGVIVR